MGALLATGKRTVTSCLRMTGRAEAANFASYHQILSRARWCPRAVAKHILAMVIGHLVPDGPIVVGLDDTIERRWGARSAPGAFTGIQCALAMATSSRRAACAGSASWCLPQCRGHA
nr:transposase [Polymorphobacter sp. PAMC 29334]